MISDLLPKDGLILCAVSGGADSVYMLMRLRELGYAVAAAHYHHGLRGAAADRDEAFVLSLCRSHGIECVTERGDAGAYAASHHLGMEEAARALRYDFLERAADYLGASVIATAHTADDNAETVLMHLTRGAGLHGLGGIPPVRGRIVRPLLDETHAQALSYLEARGISHAEDETNASDDMTRNRIRHTVIPALLRENPAFFDAVGRMTAHLREDEGYLSGLAEGFLRENRTENSLPAKALAALPRPVSLRVIRIMAGAGVSEKQAEAVLSIAQNGGFADVSGMRVGASGGKLVFSLRAPAALPDRALEPGQRLLLPEAGMALICEKIPIFPADVHKSFNTFIFQCESICGSMTVGARRPGDKYRPAGRGCTKTVNQLLAEANVPVWERDSVPVVRDDAGVLCLYGAPAAERASVRAGGEFIQIRFIREDT